MPRENKSNEELIHKLEQIRVLLGESIALTTKGIAPQRLHGRESTSKSAARIGREIDFSMPMRPFIKKYSNRMSGPKKFTLVLAYLAKGDMPKKVPLESIQKHWNKMTANGLLGMKFNRFYSGQAKDNDWVSAEDNGLYHLRPSWKEIFNEGK